MEDNITRAIKALGKSVNDSSLTISEKEALKRLVEIMLNYYIDEYKEDSLSLDSHSKLAKLISRMMDYIVAINCTINGQNDVFCIVNIIYKEINYDKQKGYFKRKRLI